MAGAPVGNQNAARAKVWRAAIMRALERRKPADQRVQAIDELADKLLELVAAGDLGALKEFGDRLDGKPAQAIVGDDDAPPVRTVSRIELVDLSDSRSDRSTR
jgi:hypothetical protein